MIQRRRGARKCSGNRWTKFEVSLNNSEVNVEADASVKPLVLLKQAGHLYLHRQVCCVDLLQLFYCHYLFFAQQHVNSFKLWHLTNIVRYLNHLILFCDFFLSAL